MIAEADRMRSGGRANWEIFKWKPGWKCRALMSRVLHRGRERERVGREEMRAVWSLCCISGPVYKFGDWVLYDQISHLLFVWRCVWRLWGKELDAFSSSFLGYLGWIWQNSIEMIDSRLLQNPVKILLPQIFVQANPVVNLPLDCKTVCDTNPGRMHCSIC